ncbi:hypothetical protein KFE25_000821 [Diacronema lutheri]|uniref:Transmembrane protein n=1 Tax=Diacronema lutheri TaxID=2081491 RepID=A0A8J5XT93_DIALT|nr:hypothetical protein KFE25_000821 [Diacronema lutheri]
MSVVSRDAVPLLPMQLARSFAVRTESELLRYLANAQFLGLAGLWQKLCAGQLPARCDKAWYFATFCGIELAEFERRALGVLDERADILGYLNGFIKPYDVIAAMTVLSTTSGWFSPDAEVVVNGTAHLLLLGAEHAMDARLSTWWPHGAPHDAQLRPSMERLSAATVVNMLHADRLRSADGTASHELTAELLARSVDEARVRQTVVMLRVAVVAACVCTVALGTFLATLVPLDPGPSDGILQPAEQGEQSTLARPAPIDSIVRANLRSVVLTFGFSGTGTLMPLCFHPSPQQRVRILVGGLFGAVVVTAATVPWLATIVRLASSLAAGAVQVGAHEPSVLVELLVASLQVIVDTVCVVRGLALYWRHRANAHKLLYTTWSSLAILQTGTSGVQLVEFAGLAALGISQNPDLARGVLAADADVDGDSDDSADDEWQGGQWLT